MTALKAKFKSAKSARVGLGDVVTFITDKPFTKSSSSWGTIVEIVDRGVTGKHMLCGIQWFNISPGKRGNITYHYESELLTLDDKLRYDALANHVIDTRLL